MLLPLLSRLNAKNIVLVSASPRRREILEKIGLSFNSVPSTFAEDLDVKNFPSISAYVKETALEKSSFYTKSLTNNPDLIIAADTVVVLNHEVIGKPVDAADAKRILEKLSGRTHTVMTGVALVVFHERDKDGLPNFTERVFHEETDVRFATLTPEMIDLYVDTQEPMGKAGAYAIQGMGASFIESIRGDYYNVVGFPANKFCTEILDLYERAILL